MSDLHVSEDIWPDVLDVEAVGNPMTRTVVVNLPIDVAMDAVTTLARKVHRNTAGAHAAFERLQVAADEFETAAGENWTTLLDPEEDPTDDAYDKLLADAGTVLQEAQKTCAGLGDHPKLYLSPTEARRIGVALFEAAYEADRLMVVS